MKRRENDGHSWLLLTKPGERVFIDAGAVGASILRTRRVEGRGEGNRETNVKAVLPATDPCGDDGDKERCPK